MHTILAIYGKNKGVRSKHSHYWL